MALFEPVDNLTKLYVPLWWYGQVDKIDDHSPMHRDLTCGGNAKFGEHGYVFDGTGDYLVDANGCKILEDGTLGEWSSIFLSSGDVPEKGNIQGAGTRIHLNSTGVAPKVTGNFILYSRYCPNIERFFCFSNRISVLDLRSLPLLVWIQCQYNQMSTLTVDTLSSLEYLYCHTNNLSVLDVSTVPLLTYLACHTNSFNQAMVDTILCDMDGHGTSNGTLNISGNAVPSAAGITCKNNLIARGWTVTTD
jgi:Leucine-rich repeat (LRR) protein